MDGLHGIFAMDSKDIVNKTVSIPVLAAASAASIPACPAPIMEISVIFDILCIILDNQYIIIISKKQSYVKY